MNPPLKRQLGIFASNEFLFIVLAFIVINAALFYKDGVMVVTDSARYIDYANNLHNGFYFDPHNFWYIGYSLYILVIQLLHGDILWIVMGQYLLSLLSVISLYHASLQIWNNKWSALCTAICYLLFIDISSWNAYVLTESLYTSFTCFSLFCLARSMNEKVNTGFILITAITILFTIFIKPTGIALAGAVLCVLIFKLIKLFSNRIIIFFLLVVIGCCFLYLVNQRLSTYLIMENYQLGEVIYGVTTLSDRPEVKKLILTPPENIYHPAVSLPPLVKIISFIFHHPLYWLRLFLAKAYYLLLHIRPFWSVSHNLLSLVILIPSYWFCIKTFFTEKSKGIIILFSVVY